MLTLAPITSANWRDACFLTTNPDHGITLDEEWLCCNAFSMLQAIYDPGWDCRLILNGNQPVGFAFFGLWEKKQAPLLCRYMIDVDQQSRGFGTCALPLIVQEMYHLYGRRDIYLTLSPDNVHAIRLYRSFGFLPTGEADDGEDIWVLPYSNKERQL